MNFKHLFACLVAACISGGAFAKLPPPKPVAPLDPVAAAAKAEKDKVAAETAKALQDGAEDRAVKNFQTNMKKAGKPIPKPTPILVAAAPSPAPAVPAIKISVPTKDIKNPALPK